MDTIEYIFKIEEAKLKKLWLKPIVGDISMLQNSQEIRDYNRYSIEKLIDTFNCFHGSNCWCEVCWRDLSEISKNFVDALCFYIDQIILSGLSYEKVLWFLNTDSIFDELKHSYENASSMYDIETADIGLISEHILSLISFVSRPIMNLRTREWDVPLPVFSNAKIAEKEWTVTDSDCFCFYHLCSYWLMAFFFEWYPFWLNDKTLKHIYDN